MPTWLLGNNVLAQVPDLNDFVAGLKILLKPEGVLTLEFPHLLRLIERNEFDTIYHEHFSYFSMLTTVRILQTHGLRVFDVEELPTHGGSLRVYACRDRSQRHQLKPAVEFVDRRRKTRRPGFARRLRKLRWAGPGHQTGTGGVSGGSQPGRVSRWRATERRARARPCCTIAALARI